MNGAASRSDQAWGPDDVIRGHAWPLPKEILQFVSRLSWKE